MLIAYRMHAYELIFVHQYRLLDFYYIERAFDKQTSFIFATAEDGSNKPDPAASRRMP